MTNLIEINDMKKLIYDSLGASNIKPDKQLILNDFVRKNDFKSFQNLLKNIFNTYDDFRDNIVIHHIVYEQIINYANETIELLTKNKIIDAIESIESIPKIEIDEYLLFKIKNLKTIGKNDFDFIKTNQDMNDYKRKHQYTNFL